MFMIRVTRCAAKSAFRMAIAGKHEPGQSRSGCYNIQVITIWSKKDVFAKGSGWIAKGLLLII